MPLVPSLIIAGTHSGAGKTSLCAGLILALTRRGLKVQSFKCGPDYIDPGYHSVASGRPCRNLDSWMLSDEQVRATFVRACIGADLAIVEGVMGMFDGSSFLDDKASAAQLARLLEIPLLLVTDISGSARSAAATVLGFARFDSRIAPAGILLNRAGSESHAKGCAQAITAHTDLPCLGWLPREDAFVLPERNLGLHLAEFSQTLPPLLGKIADRVETHFELEAILSLAASACSNPLAASATQENHSVSPAAQGQVQTSSSLHASVKEYPRLARGEKVPLLAVPRDEAFCFHYQDNLDLLQDAGIEVRFFSPLAGEGVPAEADGAYLVGGYPELFASRLAANTTFLDSLRRLHDQGRPLLAECGGFMVLTQGIQDTAGLTHPMAGLVPGETIMTERLQGMGYRLARSQRDTLLAAKGQVLRAHEFHYSRWQHPDVPKESFAFSSTGTDGSSRQEWSGWAEKNLLASYLHFHFAQDPALVLRFKQALCTR